MEEITLGCTYRDVVTGFQGVATGFVRYLSGCNQTLLVPLVSPDGAHRESHWFDVQRMRLVSGVAQIMLDNDATPGFDKPAPKR